MTRASAASADWAWMVEVAGEELAKLEAAHPGRFGPLKAELERLVAEPGFDAAVVAFPPVAPHAAATSHVSSQPDAAPLAAPMCTQESSTGRKRKPGGGEREREEVKRRKRWSTTAPPGRKKDRADMAIERAERCLEMIRARRHQAELARRLDPLIKTKRR